MDGGLEPPLPELEDTRPNILLISLDALRADHLGAYGHGNATSPFLDHLAAEGLLFTQSFVNTHGTPPSHATLFSSLYQESHRVSYEPKLEDWRPHQVPSGLPWLPTLLRQAGYQTFGVTDGGFMGEGFGFGQGFDRFDDGGDGIDSRARALRKMLGEASEGPIFAFLHTYEIHSPYLPPPPYGDLFGQHDSDLEPTSEALRALQNDASDLDREDFAFLKAQYDGGIRFTDDRLRELFAELDATGFLDHALVVITSDHGEEFGEHGGLLHRDTLYEELLRVPLIFWGSALTTRGIDRRLVTTIDVAPTLLRAVGMEPDPRMVGRDLLAAEQAPIEFAQIYAQYADRRLSVRTERWKLIESPAEGLVELYDLENDPGETTNVALEQRRLVRRLRQRLAEWKAGCPPILSSEGGPAPLTKEELERLKALGYVD